MKDFWLGKSNLSKVIATLASIITVFAFVVGINSLFGIVDKIKERKQQPTTEALQTVSNNSSEVSTTQLSSKDETDSNVMDLMIESNVFKGESGYYTITGSDWLTANNNQTFRKGACFYVGNDGSCKTITFLLNGEYKYISGYFYLPKENKNLSYMQYFSVIGDEKTIYQSKALTAGVEPIEFEISVENIKTLVFEFSDEGATNSTFLSSSNRSSHYLAEVYAYS